MSCWRSIKIVYGGEKALNALMERLKANAEDTGKDPSKLKIDKSTFGDKEVPIIRMEEGILDTDMDKIVKAVKYDDGVDFGAMLDWH